MDGAKERRSEEQRSERLTERKATERKSDGATDGRSDGAKSDGAISLYIKIEKKKKKGASARVSCGARKWW